MITLGINAAFHDSAAALVVDGQVVAAAEEERFSRIKHAKRPVPFSAWELPYGAIDFCLEQAGLALRDVEHVAYSFDPKVFVDSPASLDDRTIPIPLNMAAGQGRDGRSPWDALFIAHIVNAPGQLADGAPHHLQRRLRGVNRDDPPYRWHFVDHHLCHQASAFLAAPFDRCAVMTLDGRGESATTTYGAYRDNRYEGLGRVVMPHSLGIFYERITAHLGFLHSSDEYKVMALAALGEPCYFEALDGLVRLDGRGGFTLQPFDAGSLLGPKRLAGEPLQQRHFDIAASAQKLLENTVLALADWLARTSGERRLAMAGGVALNCVANSVLRDSRIFDQVWIQPAAGDAGTALGAALWTDARERLAGGGPALSSGRGDEAFPLAPRGWQMDHAYLGPEFDDAEIERQLAWAKIPYRKADDLARETAALLAANLVIGWFQGRMEYGPRALGARSIVASPIDPGMQARLNELKDREDFRPVAPAVTAEAFAEWFEPADANAEGSPFMLFTYRVCADRAERIPSACHTDRTARAQCVSRGTNPRFHGVIEAFGELTGVPVVVNTSFNVRGQPIVCTPTDAIEAFFGTPLDALVIGSFIVLKRELAPARA